MNYDKKDIKKWIKALRSGKFKQTKYALQDRKGFCCLGVACKIFIKKPDLNDHGFLWGSYPTQHPNAPMWLREVNGKMGELVGVQLSDLNDYADYRFSFNQIADVIELALIEEKPKKAKELIKKYKDENQIAVVKKKRG